MKIEQFLSGFLCLEDIRIILENEILFHFHLMFIKFPFIEKTFTTSNLN